MRLKYINSDETQTVWENKYRNKEESNEEKMLAERKNQPKFQYLKPEEMEKFCESSDWDSQESSSESDDCDSAGSRLSHGRPSTLFFRTPDDLLADDAKSESDDENTKHEWEYKYAAGSQLLDLDKFPLNEKEIELVEEDVLLECVQERQHDERYFDVSLSGTSGTLVIVLPKKIIVGWVGDSQVAWQK